MSKQPAPAPIASAIGPCPTIILIVGRPGTGSLPRTIAPPDHPLLESKSVDDYRYLTVYTHLSVFVNSGQADYNIYGF